MKINFRKLPVLTVARAEEEFGVKFNKKKFKRSGIYCIESGSRGEIDESTIEFVDTLDVTSITVPSKKECWDLLGIDDAEDAEERQSIRDHVGEFYGVAYTDIGAEFSYTEEEATIYIKIEV